MTMPGWQVARMWLGDLVSHLAAEALWALTHINEIRCYHTPTVSAVSILNCKLSKKLIIEYNEFNKGNKRK